MTAQEQRKLRSEVKEKDLQEFQNDLQEYRKGVEYWEGSRDKKTREEEEHPNNSERIGNGCKIGESNGVQSPQGIYQNPQVLAAPQRSRLTTQDSSLGIEPLPPHCALQEHLDQGAGATDLGGGGGVSEEIIPPPRTLTPEFAKPPEGRDTRGACNLNRVILDYIEKNSVNVDIISRSLIEIWEIQHQRGSLCKIREDMVREDMVREDMAQPGSNNQRPQEKMRPPAPPAMTKRRKNSVSLSCVKTHTHTHPHAQHTQPTDNMDLPKNIGDTSNIGNIGNRGNINNISNIGSDMERIEQEIKNMYSYLQEDLASKGASTSIHGEDSSLCATLSHKQLQTKMQERELDSKLELMLALQPDERSLLTSPVSLLQLSPELGATKHIDTTGVMNSSPALQLGLGSLQQSTSRLNTDAHTQGRGVGNRSEVQNVRNAQQSAHRTLSVPVRKNTTSTGTPHSSPRAPQILCVNKYCVRGKGGNRNKNTRLELCADCKRAVAKKQYCIYCRQIYYTTNTNKCVLDGLNWIECEACQRWVYYIYIYIYIIEPCQLRGKRS